MGKKENREEVEPEEPDEAEDRAEGHEEGVACDGYGAR